MPFVDAVLKRSPGSDDAERAGICLAATGSPLRLCAMILAPSPAGEAFTQTAAYAQTFVDGIVTHFNPAIRDFAEARNRLLAKAAAAGYDWAVMLDTDERIQCDDWHALRAQLAESRAALILAPSRDGGYEKERIFRLPSSGRYIGPTHECFVLDAGAPASLRLATLTFTARPKTDEQLRAKSERDLELLVPYTQEHPEQARWWYYLADAYAGLGQYENAVAAFAACYRLNGWAEQSAWAAYRTALLWIDDDPAQALDWCLLGMQRHPGMAELPLLAGWCCFWLGRYQHAVWWATLAAALNSVSAARERRSFRTLPALFEAPFDLMRRAAKVLEDDELARHAERRFAELFLLREGWSPTVLTRSREEREERKEATS